MSTNPYASPTPFGDPMGYRPPTPETPAAATVFGILNIMFAVLGLCGSAFSAIVFFIPFNQQMVAQNPMLKLMNENAAYRLFTHGSVIVGFIGGLVLLAAGIGLLMKRPFGRQLSLGWAIYGIVFVILTLVVNVLVVFPMMNKHLGELAPGADPAIARMGTIIGIVSNVIGTVISLIYPALLLYFMNTPKVVAAFRSESAG